MTETSLHWMMIGGWLLLSFFLSGMEAGVFELSRLRIRQMARAGKGNARRLLGYMDRPEDFLWTILVGNTLSNFAAVALMIGDLRRWSSDRVEVFSPLLLIMGLCIYLTCELLPKRLFQRFPNRLCMYLVLVFAGIHIVLSPVFFLIDRFSAVLLWINGDRVLSGRLFGNRDELKALIQESTGALSKSERSLIGRILDAQNLTVGRVAHPLESAVSLTSIVPVAEWMEIGGTTGYTRFPVWSTAAKTRRIEGIVSLKDLLYSDLDPTRPLVRDWLRPALFMDGSVRIEEALRIFQRSGQHMAIIRGVNGVETGVVTLTDILRALFMETSG